MLSGGKFHCGGRKVGGIYFLRCLLHFFTMSAVTKYLSSDKVVEFCNAIFDAGIRLSSLLTAEYPKASLVSKALYDVTKVVEEYGLEG